MLKLSVFLIVGLILLVAAVLAGVDTRDWLKSSAVALGHVTRLNAGGSHPQIEFTTPGGQTVSYPQGGLIGGWEVGDAVSVLYNPDLPSQNPTIDRFLAIWTGPIALAFLGLGFTLSSMFGFWMFRKSSASTGAHRVTLRETYLVYDQERLVGALRDPVPDDMFWISFALTAVDDAAATVLYDEAFWSLPGRISIREQATQRPVTFILSIQHSDDPDLDEAPAPPAALMLRNRPSRIMLRGPYTADKA